MAMSLRNGSHFPTTQCACVDLEDFATQRNGGGGCEKNQEAYTRQCNGRVSESCSYLSMPQPSAQERVVPLYTITDRIVA
jgi:hypothetical protein